MAKEVKSFPLKFKTVVLSALGGGLECYDFIIFAIFAKNIGDTFFPASSTVATLIQSYLVFAIGYLARPLGGVIFSHFGDLYGRKKSFSVSISMMGISTLLMSFLPGFDKWGLLATVVFILLRIFQGLSIGGEIPGALVFVSEHFPLKKGAACAIILLFLNCGLLLGDLIHVLLTRFLPENLFNAYGWRIAFFIGGFSALISFYIRRSLEETHSFLESSQKHQLPFVMLMKQYKQRVFQVFALTGAAACITSIFLLYFNSYAQSILHLSSIGSGSLALHQLLVFMIMSCFSGFLTDRWGCYNLLKHSSTYLIAGPLMTFYFINQGGSIEPILLLNAAAMGIFAGAMPCYLSELFPVCVRYTGVAMGYNLGFAIFGGLSPLISSLLIKTFQWNEAPGFLITLSGFLAFFSLRIKAPPSDVFKG